MNVKNIFLHSDLQLDERNVKWYGIKWGGKVASSLTQTSEKVSHRERK